MDGVPGLEERRQLREQYAERAARDPYFRWRYYRRLRREHRDAPTKHVLLVGRWTAEELDEAVAGKPELEERWTRTLPDGRVQYIATVLDYNP